jgi:hypothetical protein
MWTTTRKTWAILAFFTFLFAYASNASTTAYSWVVFGSLFSVLLMVGKKKFFFFQNKKIIFRIIKFIKKLKNLFNKKIQFIFILQSYKFFNFSFNNFFI